MRPYTTNSLLNVGRSKGCIQRPRLCHIDLLLDRADNTMNLIEIKFSQGPFTIDKKYAEALRRKRETFRAVTGTKKNLFVTLLTTHGLTQNAYAAELAEVSIQTGAMFTEL